MDFDSYLSQFYRLNISTICSIFQKQHPHLSTTSIILTCVHATLSCIISAMWCRHRCLLSTSKILSKCLKSENHLKLRFSVVFYYVLILTWMLHGSKLFLVYVTSCFFTNALNLEISTLSFTNVYIVFCFGIWKMTYLSLLV